MTPSSLVKWMHVWVIRVYLVLVLVSLNLDHVVAAEPKGRIADLVLRNGAVYTVDAVRSWAGAVAVRDERIVYVGTDREVEPWIGDHTVVVDLGGRMLLPGFHDSHLHPVDGGISLGECSLHDATSEEQVLELVETFARDHPQALWIRGSGWQLPIFRSANPHKTLLDGIVPDRPVYLSAADGHSAWVNSRALEIAGISRDSQDPLQGRIERDPTTGEPTGTLREAAMDLVRSHLPAYTDDTRLQGLRRALALANQFGITSLQEARAEATHLLAYQVLEERGELTARVVASLSVDPTKGIDQVPVLVDLRRKYQGRLLRPHAAKIFADGVIEAGTAALLEPYLGTKGDRGKANLEPGHFNALAEALDREGFQIHIHAIGDRAIRTSLDALEFARMRNGTRDARHHLVHLQLFDPRDIPRLRSLGVVANFQPFWAYEEEYIKELTVPVLGPVRSRWLYPIRSVAQSGATVVFGSDWDVSSMNPLDGMQVALTRRGLNEEPGAGWISDETVDLRTAIAAYTINGAYLAFQERQTGSIEIGKLADLVVLDRNLFEIPPQMIHQCRVLLTLLGGKAVHCDPAFPYAGPRFSLPGGVSPTP